MHKCCDCPNRPVLDFVCWIGRNIAYVLGIILLVGVAGGIIVGLLIPIGWVGNQMMVSLSDYKCSFVDVEHVIPCAASGSIYLLLLMITLVFVNVVLAPIHFWAYSKHDQLLHLKIGLAAIPLYYCGIELLGVIGAYLVPFSKSDVCDFQSYYRFMNMTCMMYGSVMTACLSVCYLILWGLYYIGCQCRNRCQRYQLLSETTTYGTV